MENRELALQDIYQRLKKQYDAGKLLVNTFQRTPTVPVKEEDLPAIFLLEDDDEVVKPSARNEFGYPATRKLEITIEVIIKTVDDADETETIGYMAKLVRASILKDGAHLANSKTTAIREVRTEGPTGYGLPGVIGLKLVFEIIYDDAGFSDVLALLV